MAINWLHLFLDTPRPQARATWQFWAAVSDSTLSAARGEREQFATLLPARGDAWLKLQAIEDGPAGVHLDLDSDDPAKLVERALDLGAKVRSVYSGVTVLRSPAGITFCATAVPAGDQDRTGESLVDQVCLDIPAGEFADEVEFWSELTGWAAAPISPDAEFVPLERPSGIPVRILLQRLGPDTPAGAHLDIACRDRDQQVARHQALGASVVSQGRGWTVLTDPAGRRYCLTDRDPATGISSHPDPE